MSVTINGFYQFYTVFALLSIVSTFTFMEERVFLAELLWPSQKFWSISTPKQEILCKRSTHWLEGIIIQPRIYMKDRTATQCILWQIIVRKIISKIMNITWICTCGKIKYQCNSCRVSTLSSSSSLMKSNLFNHLPQKDSLTKSL